MTTIEAASNQYLYIQMPETCSSYDREKKPMVMRPYAGGDRAAQAQPPPEFDATGRGLREGFVVAIPGTRALNSQLKNEKGDTVFTGRAPPPLLDLKAAVRYLRHNHRLMPRSADRTIIDGPCAGGAVAAVLGATAKPTVSEEALHAKGAA